MLLRHANRSVGRSFSPLACCLLLIWAAVGRMSAAPVGPTLHLDYGRGQPQENPTSAFMYFVPLISPEPVTVSTSAGNTQCARVTSSVCQVCGTSFTATCEFTFGGAGSVCNRLDHTELIRRNQKELAAGGSLKRQLTAINVEGRGSGRVEIEGVVTNGVRRVNLVRLLFGNRHSASPVFISLEDISCPGGRVQAENELVAQVNSLVFRRTPGRTQMQITVASLKPKGAADSLWQNFMGGFKGMLVNQLLPPIGVSPTGHQAILDFGLALADAEPAFTFPYAERLR
jgi:hypothetical protein